MPMPISEAEMVLRLGVAIVLGGAIGYEREVREHPAGLRTHLLVSLASATFGLVSFHVAFFQHYTRDGLINIDVSRIAASIVTGIGFLGGGAILKAGMTIKGLTTAASLWLVSAVGLAAGGGMYLLATASTAFSLFALVVLRYLVEGPRKRVVRLAVRIDMHGDFLGRAGLIETLRPVGAALAGISYSRDLTNNWSRLDFTVDLPGSDHEEPLIKRLEAVPGVRRIRVVRPEDGLR
jgi:putative Mg2+ transporter-C (MgtC) family protein